MADGTGPCLSAPLMTSVDSALIVTAGLLLGFLGASAASRLGRRRRRRAATAVALPGGRSVTFEAPARRRLRDRRRVQLNGLIFAGYGIWAALLTVHGAPVLGPVAAVVFLELALASLRVSAVTGTTVTDEDSVARVAPLLDELCARAGSAVPTVVLRDDTVRAAAVRGRRTHTTLVLSRPFVRRVDDAALRALLAHEVVHLVRDDLSAARRRAVVALLVGIGLAGASTAWAHLPGIEGLPIWLAAILAGVMAARAGLSLLNRPRERRADLEGARLCGDPGALARALAEAQALSEETRARLYGPAPWRWLLSPLSWRMPSHPPMASRIALLRSLA